MSASTKARNKRFVRVHCNVSAGFDPDKFNPRVMLPNENGTYHICEGQHRRAAIEMFKRKGSK